MEMATGPELIQLYGLLLPKKTCCKHHPASQEGILLNTPGGK